MATTNNNGPRNGGRGDEEHNPKEHNPAYHHDREEDLDFVINGQPVDNADECNIEELLKKNLTLLIFSK